MKIPHWNPKISHMVLGSKSTQDSVSEYRKMKEESDEGVKERDCKRWLKIDQENLYVFSASMCLCGLRALLVSDSHSPHGAAFFRAHHDTGLRKKVLSCFSFLEVFSPQFYWGMTGKNCIYLGWTTWFFKGVQCVNLICTLRGNMITTIKLIHQKQVLKLTLHVVSGGLSLSWEV